MFKRLMTTALLFGMAALGPPALAAGCAQRDVVVKRLADLYAERLTAGGLQHSQSTRSVMEIWTSTETGSFTVLVTSPQGISCVVATGTDYFDAPDANAPGGKAS